MGAGTLRRLSFRRGARLKQGRDFTRLRQEGRRLAFGCLALNWQKAQGRPASRLGVITSGKIGAAVVRNRARRLVREAFRIHQHELALPVDLVVIARHSIVQKGFAEVEKDLLTTLRKVRLLNEPTA
jgi:ribonuclease P protein component